MVLCFLLLILTWAMTLCWALLPCVSVPMASLVLVIAYGTVVSLFIGYVANIFMAHIIFMVYLGGLLVMFGYIVALASNPSFSLKEVEGKLMFWLVLSKVSATSVFYLMSLKLENAVVGAPGYMSLPMEGMCMGWACSMCLPGLACVLLYCMVSATGICSRGKGTLRASKVTA